MKLLRYMGAATVVVLLVACESAVLAAPEDSMNAVEGRVYETASAPATGEWVLTPTPGDPAVVTVLRDSSLDDQKDPSPRPEDDPPTPPASVSGLPTLTLYRSGGGTLRVTEGEWFRVLGSSQGAGTQPNGITSYQVINSSGLRAGKVLFKYKGNGALTWINCSTAGQPVGGVYSSVPSGFGDSRYMTGEGSCLFRVPVGVDNGDSGETNDVRTFTFQSLDKKWVEPEQNDADYLWELSAPQAVEGETVEVRVASLNPDHFSGGSWAILRVGVYEERHGYHGVQDGVTPVDTEWVKVGRISFYQTGLADFYGVYGCGDLSHPPCMYEMPERVPRLDWDRYKQSFEPYVSVGDKLLLGAGYARCKQVPGVESVTKVWFGLEYPTRTMLDRSTWSS